MEKVTELHKAFKDAYNQSPVGRENNLFSDSVAPAFCRKRHDWVLDKIADYFVCECFVAGQTQYLSLSVVKQTERKTTTSV